MSVIRDLSKVIQPQLLLFLDEPTSGLDSQSAWAIVSFLRSLADGGQAILCTLVLSFSLVISDSRYLSGFTSLLLNCSKYLTVCSFSKKAARQFILEIWGTIPPLSLIISREMGLVNVCMKKIRKSIESLFQYLSSSIEVPNTCWKSSVLVQQQLANRIGL